ncbi:MAG: hypothetical protein K9G26_10465 [Emcibacter sp.]|nr:hypothetical protein [Emcibacter sp.]
MKKLFLHILFLFCTITYASAVEKTVGVKISFADIKTGQNILTADDNYMNRMAPAEIAIRSASQTPDKTTHDLKALYQENVLEWTEQEKHDIKQLIEKNREKIDKLSPLLPSDVILVKTTNKVEGGMPHTRANAIILPIMGEPMSEYLFFHELFHILSRHQKDRHQSLYALIGFKPCVFLNNDELRAQSLTNPDVPSEGYYLPVEIDHKPSAVMTFLHTTKKAFDPEIKGGFGGHFGFGLLKVKVDNGKCLIDIDDKNQAQIFDPDTVPDFFAAIGHNTSYIIHAEEVLADNFAFAMLGKKDLPNPEVTEHLKIWLGLK